MYSLAVAWTASFQRKSKPDPPKQPAYHYPMNLHAFFSCQTNSLAAHVLITLISHYDSSISPQKALLLDIDTVDIYVRGPSHADPGHWPFLHLEEQTTEEINISTPTKS